MSTRNQGAALLYGTDLGPWARHPRFPGDRGGQELSGLTRSPKELLEMGGKVVREDRMRSAHIARNLERLVERYLGGEQLETCLRAPLAVAVALSTPERDHAWISTFGQSYAFRNCGGCGREMTDVEVHVHDMGVKQQLNRFCMSCIKAEGSITEPIEGDPEIAVHWIEQRLRELGRLPT